jgi:hypothetical protein
MVVDKEGTSSATNREGREAAADGGPGSELKPGQERKELEGVFVVRDNKARSRR